MDYGENRVYGKMSNTFHCTCRVRKRKEEKLREQELKLKEKHEKLKEEEARNGTHAAG